MESTKQSEQPGAQSENQPPQIAVPPSNVLREELEAGLKYTHLVCEGLKNQVAGSAGDLYALVDLLIRKGVVSYRELEQAKVLAEEAVSQGMEAVPGVKLGPEIDKYALSNLADIPCERKLHLCQAACCRLVFPLGLQDLTEGVVRWNYLRPYYNARNQDGYCVHCKVDCTCEVYQYRPAICRSYDCRTDQRIWANFDEEKLNPDFPQSLKGG